MGARSNFALDLARYRRYGAGRTFLARAHLRSLRVLLGVWISPHARIGGGLLINHFGAIWINPEAVIGRFCNLHHGVTIGVGGRGHTRGVPRLGDRVNLSPYAVLLGDIRIGDDVLIGAPWSSRTSRTTPWRSESRRASSPTRGAGSRRIRPLRRTRTSCICKRSPNSALLSS